MTIAQLQSLFEQALHHQQAGNFEQANRLYGQLLEPPSSDGLVQAFRAGVWLHLRRCAEALACFDNAITAGIAPPELLVDRAVALAELNRLDEAVAGCDAALAAKPDFAHAHFIRADCLRQAGRLDEALAGFTAALALQPDFVAARLNRGVTRMALGRPAEALADFEQLVALQPGDAELQVHRGLALAELDRLQDAVATFDQALAIAPDHIVALHNRGAALWRMERLEEALASYDRVLAIRPDAVVTLSNRANTLGDLLRLDEAGAAHDRVVAMAPDYAAGQGNRAMHLLQVGRWEEGLQAYEWRKRRPELRVWYPDFAQPEWRGEDISGKTLLVYADQALGDTIHFCRYLALVRAKGARVILRVQEQLVRLLSSLMPPAELVAMNAPLPDFDCHAALTSLPLLCGTRTDTIPGAVPYLAAEPQRVARWAERLGGGGFRIGVCWQGSNRGGDRSRFFRALALAPLANVPGVRLISLQKDGADTEGVTIENLGNEFDVGHGAFLDSAAVMQSLDLVIGPDTAIAHLAGALARPTWLALKRSPEWRWLLNRDDSPWYPGMRLFRQSAPGDWNSVFTAMGAALDQRNSAS